MHRRDFLHAGLTAGVLGTTGFRKAERADAAAYYELRTYELRTDLNPGRLRTFYKDALLPAFTRAGAGTVGLFAPQTGYPSQSLMAVIEYPSLAAIEQVGQHLENDSAYTTARRTFETADDLPYVRYDSQLMRAFAGHRRIEVPPQTEGRPSRMFELRTYEARSAAALERKIAMFNDAEITLFRQIGMTPVFFGENIYGTRLPSLTYMITFDDIAARTKAWATFGSHPDWQRINSDEKWKAVGSVTVTNVAYLSPLPFSPIR